MRLTEDEVSLATEVMRRLEAQDRSIANVTATLAARDDVLGSAHELLLQLADVVDRLRSTERRTWNS